MNERPRKRGHCRRGLRQNVFEHEGELVMVKNKRERKWMVAGLLAAALSAFILTGCFATAGNHMNWQPVDMGQVLASDAGNQKWNTYRFQTVGPFAQQRIAYVMFNDDITMDMWYTPYVNLGKMSVREVLQNHDAYLKQCMWVGTALVFQEYRRDGKLIAYTANEFRMDVDLWEMAAEGPKLDLRMIYIDRRSFSGGGGPGDPGPQ
jgi:hypothetical protein